MDPISVLLVDDHPGFVRAAARLLREHDDEVAVVGTAGGGEEALVQAQDLEPDIVVMNLTLENPASLELIPRLRAMLPLVKIIVLTLLDSQAYRKAALAAGADGFLSKASVNTDLLPAIRRVVGTGRLGQIE